MPPARKSYARARRVRDLLALPDASNRRDQAESHCGPGRSVGKKSFGDQRAYVGTSRALLRLYALGRARRCLLERFQVGRHVSPRIFAARSSTERGSVERPADGDEIPGADAAEEGRVRAIILTSGGRSPRLL